MEDKEYYWEDSDYVSNFQMSEQFIMGDCEDNDEEYEVREEKFRVIVFIQDGSGSRTLTLSSDFESPAAGGITLSTTANATDIVPYIILGPDRILLGTPQLAFG